MSFIKALFLFTILFISSHLEAQDESSAYTTAVPEAIAFFRQEIKSLLINGKIDAAWTVYEKMVAATDTTDDVLLQAWTWYLYGNLLSYSERYPESNNAFQKAIDLSNKMLSPNATILIRGHNNLYYNNDELGNIDVAFENVLKAYEYLAYASPEESKSNIIFNLARALKRHGEVGMASRYMEQVLELDNPQAKTHDG